MKHKLIAVGLSLLSGVQFAHAGETVYKVGSGTRAQQVATVESVTDFETFTGVTDAVTGTLKIDLSKQSVLGNIVVQVGSIKTGIDKRDEHMRSEMWMDTEKYKTIEFVATSSRKAKGNTYSVSGNFTMHGVTKAIKSTVAIKQMAESEATRAANFKGDVVQLKTSFQVKLNDFGIVIPKMSAAKVSDTVMISVTVYGQTG